MTKYIEFIISAIGKSEFEKKILNNNPLGKFILTSNGNIEASSDEVSYYFQKVCNSKIPIRIYNDAHGSRDINSVLFDQNNHPITYQSLADSIALLLAEYPSDHPLPLLSFISCYTAGNGQDRSPIDSFADKIHRELKYQHQLELDIHARCYAVAAFKNSKTTLSIKTHDNFNCLVKSYKNHKPPRFSYYSYAKFFKLPKFFGQHQVIGSKLLFKWIKDESGNDTQIIVDAYWYKYQKQLTEIKPPIIRHCPNISPF